MSPSIISINVLPQYNRKPVIPRFWLSANCLANSSLMGPSGEAFTKSARYINLNILLDLDARRLTELSGGPMRSFTVTHFIPETVIWVEVTQSNRGEQKAISLKLGALQRIVKDESQLYSAMARVIFMRR